MKLATAIRDFFVKPKPQTREGNSTWNKREFEAAIQSRLTSDWLAGNTTADAEIKQSLKQVRDRCRDLERNNDYVRRYLKLLENNVLGSNGIGLQMKIRERTQKKGIWTEQYDSTANSLIEEAWNKWSKPEFCTVGRRLSWVDVQRICLRSVARDGSIFIRKHYPQDNPFFFSLEPIEADHLDTDFNATDKGSYVRLGVRYDNSGRITHYYLLRNHPGDNFQPRFAAGAPYREPVPVEKMIHLYLPERVGQSTGMPWLVSAVLRLKHLAAYEEAEVVAARMGAAKMGFLEPQQNAAGPGYAGATDARGNKYMEVEPGSIEQLPYGYTFKPYDPSHPNAAFKDFVKATLRGISAGLGVSYVSLANDIESVNYSSIRSGMLEEREEWKMIQGWFITWLIQAVFEDWLKTSLSFGAIGSGNLVLPASKFDKFNSPEWKPRRWDWVDPLDDLQAAVLAVEKGFKSRRAIISEGGGDIEDTNADIAADKALDEQYGLDFSDPAKEQASDTPKKPDSVDKTKEVKSE